MNVNDFLSLMQDKVLMSDFPVSLDSNLKDLDEWDSLAYVSFIALANSHFNRRISRQQLNEVVFVRDLFDLLS